MFKDNVSRFIQYYYGTIRQTPTWFLMENTVEDSSWHREANVAIHTDMVVAHYLSDPTFYTSTERVYWIAGAFACAFHDFGKPASEEVCHSDERGEYRRYRGHELVSAREWEDFISDKARFYEVKQLFQLSDTDMGQLFYLTGFMIEHHLMYGITKKHKLNIMRNSISWDWLRRVAIADCWGRVSDDHDDKKANVLAWFRNFREQTEVKPPVTNAAAPEVVILVGASGVGKTSVRMREYADTHHHYSWDDLRITLYTTDEERSTLGDAEVYNLAFGRAAEDTAFDATVRSVWQDLLRTKVNIVVDNTNTSAKRRRSFITSAKQAGYTVKVVLFPMTKEELLSSISSREDKTVPQAAVQRMWENTQIPLFGEIDELSIKFSFSDDMVTVHRSDLHL